MLPELKKKWIEALRSGKYKQGVRALRSLDDKFCCLGVLCDIEDVPCVRSEGLYKYQFGTQLMTGSLTVHKSEQIGMSWKDMGDLIEMNDHGKTFAEIATYIERNL